MKNDKQSFAIHRLTFSGVMLAIATAISVACSLIPFFGLPYGGTVTLASMLPIVIVSYVYGVKWGLFTSFTYAVIQVIADLVQGKSSVILALPADGFGAVQVISIILIDYFLAYTVLGLGGIFRNKIKNKTASLVLGSVVALFLRYVMHTVSGFIFYGSYAEWFFTQDGIYKIGKVILDSTKGQLLAFVYSVIYNGMYMLPEIIITAVAAVAISRLPQIKKYELN